MLVSTFEPRLGAGGAIRVPAELRRALGSEITISREGALAIAALRSHAQYDAEITAAVGTARDWRDAARLQRFFAANAVDDTLEPSGRVILPEFMTARHRAGPGTDLAMVCFGGRAVVLTTTTWHRIRSMSRDEELTSELLPLGTFTASIVDDGTGDAVAEAVLGSLYGRGAKRAGEFRRGRRLELEVAGRLATADIGIVELTQPSHDQGVDLIVHLRSGNRHNTLYVQCKSGGRKAVVTEVRELIGCVARDGACAGLLVVTSGTTRASEDEARTSKVPVDIVDARRLSGWLATKFHSSDE